MERKFYLVHPLMYSQPELNPGIKDDHEVNTTLRGIWQANILSLVRSSTLKAEGFKC